MTEFRDAMPSDWLRRAIPWRLARASGSGPTRQHGQQARNRWALRSVK